jgi:hypothetical protein
MNMNNTIFKSIGAVLGGLIFIVITSTVTDALLENAGVLPQGHLFVGPGLILMVLGYRAVLSLIGCYLTARLAPRNPTAHALSLGMIGIIFSAVGAIAMADRGPAWYGWTLTALAMPIAWLGAKLDDLRRPQPA